MQTPHRNNPHKFEREYFGNTATRSLSGILKLSVTQKVRAGQEKGLSGRIQTFTLLLIRRLDYLVFPNWEMPWLSPRPAPRA